MNFKAILPVLLQGATENLGFDEAGNPARRAVVVPSRVCSLSINVSTNKLLAKVSRGKAL